MAWDLFTNAIPAFRYNKKCPETIGTFFIFNSIWAKRVTFLNFYLEAKTVTCSITGDSDNNSGAFAIKAFAISPPKCACLPSS